MANTFEVPGNCPHCDQTIGIAPIDTVLTRRQIPCGFCGKTIDLNDRWSDVLPAISNAYEPEIFTLAAKKWAEVQPLSVPLSMSITLWEGPLGQILIEKGRATPPGYAPNVHGLGTNHGYRETKGRPGVIDSIPEVQDWPEYAEALTIINDEATLFETIGCEKTIQRVDESDRFYAFGARAYIGSYTDIAFTNPNHRLDALNYLRAAARVLRSAGMISNWSFVTMALQPLGKSWHVTLHITSHGVDESQAREEWGDTLKKAATGISRVRL